MNTFVHQGVNTYLAELKKYKASALPVADEALKDNVAIHHSDELAKAKLQGMEEALGLSPDEIKKYKAECGIEI